VLTDTRVSQSLRSLDWYFPESSLAFHPRAYNLSEEADFEHFETDFKWTAASSVLRRVLRDGGYHPSSVPSPECVQLALRVCQARLDHTMCAALASLEALLGVGVRTGSSSSAFCKRNRHDACIMLFREACAVVSLRLIRCKLLSRALRT
jgi:hypothetical protein